MLNSPFSFTNSNTTHEKIQNSSPSIFMGQNVLLSQEQHRQIFDTLTTSVSQLPVQNFYMHNQQLPCNFFQPAAPFGYQMQPYVPNEKITFTFPPNLAPKPWENGGSLDQMQRKTAMDLLALGNQLEEVPPKLSFHLDNQTSTTDLTNQPGGLTSDLNNLLQFNTEQDKFEHRKLVLKSPPEKITGSICDCLSCTNGKKVTFENENAVSEETQAHICCQCCGCSQNTNKDKEEKRKTKPSKKKKKRTKKESTDTSSSDTDNERK